MPGVSSPAVKEASESQIMIFTPSKQDLRLQAFPLISVKLCRKGLLEMRKGIGIWLPGSMQGIPTPLRMLLAGGITCSVPMRGCTPETGLLFGLLGEAQGAFAPENLGASPERSNMCQSFVIFAHTHRSVNSIFRVQTKYG